MTNFLKNVFISHIHEDDRGLPKLKQILSDHNLDVRDSSINSGNPNDATDENYIKYSILAPKIDWASTLIVYVTADTCHSAWVNWEIEYAASLGKRVVGVWAEGEQGCELPDALKEYRDALVGWHGNSIVEAIVEDQDKSELPDGTAAPVLPIKRHPCGAK
ncbi:TIR domain-containing protein [Rhizobium leguminosarum]|uniref:TIR domain-containing protein n=1 Tax=Rhizobium leguminosarum TaxID=384 RepID=UPI0010307186|nr:TIR domain-containing protein [Rhizobium leguminosarum]TBD04823.1 TIR domain-containing protein [Rhizobium leguminosarum]